ncbi:MAG TPA: hypothetical protein VFK80_01895 [Limnochordia bacterium]|nr:hypothetical protein [Limnochordia bacterium]
MKPRTRKARSGRGYGGLARNALTIGSITFAVSLGFSAPAEQVLEHVRIGTGVALLGAIVLIAVLTDIIAVAAVSATESPFHAMASNRVPGAREAVTLVRYRHRMNSFFADVIGEVSGTVGGASGTAMVATIHASYFPGIPESVISIVVVGLVASFIVGGKAFTKELAVRHATPIIANVGRFVYGCKQVLRALHILKPARRLGRPHAR